MDVDFLGYVGAKGEFSAMEEFRKGNYTKNPNQHILSNIYSQKGNIINEEK